jgi:5-methylthioribose kinase
MNRNSLPFFIDEINEVLVDYLMSNNIIEQNESVIKLEKFSGGNMNFVMRVITSKRTFVLKQAKPWVEKYPQVLAPVERTTTEATFYKIIKSNDRLVLKSPKLIHSDSLNHVLILEDLGNSQDFSYLYKDQKQLSEDEGKQLMDFLNELHGFKIGDYPSNLEMKVLNHEHIFNYPFVEENGFDLDTIVEGLQVASLPYKTNFDLKKRILELGQIYLFGEGSSLLHGDYYPGSWLKTHDGIKIIDQEFSFRGKPEFELGVFLAHLYITFHDQDFIDATFLHYNNIAKIDKPLMNAFAGVEILRRIIGLAQLPIILDLEQRESLLAFGAKLIL